jgi:amidase
MTDLASLDATAQAELVRRGEVSAVELVEAAIDRIGEVNPRLNAIIHPRFERALDEAAGDLPDGPFTGVPFVLKDLDGHSAGDPYHAGTRLLADHWYVAPDDSWLVARFRRAGLVLVGRTNTPEFGLLPTTEPQHRGPTRNPWDTRRSTGGSSGGSAAAVASGMVPLGHAGDGGGSIRIPAAHCGLVGLKPSRGRHSLGPHAGESWGGLVARLVVSRTVRDTAAMLEATWGTLAGDPYTAPPPTRSYVEEARTVPGRLRIGFRTATPPAAGVETHAAGVAAVHETARALEALGHVVVEAAPAALDHDVGMAFVNCFAVWTAAEIDRAAALIGQPATPDGFEATTWAVGEMGRAVRGTDYLAGLEALHAHARRLLGWWAPGQDGPGYDLLLTPTVAEPPPVLGQFDARDGNPLAGLVRAAPVIAFTVPFNITGQPAVSLPVHATAEGLPVGVQLVADAYREDVLLQVAAQLEQAMPWSMRSPSVHA